MDAVKPKLDMFDGSNPQTMDASSKNMKKPPLKPALKPSLRPLERPPQRPNINIKLEPMHRLRNKYTAMIMDKEKKNIPLNMNPRISQDQAKQIQKNIDKEVE